MLLLLSPTYPVMISIGVPFTLSSSSSPHVLPSLLLLLQLSSVLLIESFKDGLSWTGTYRTLFQWKRKEERMETTSPTHIILRSLHLPVPVLYFSFLSVNTYGSTSPLKPQRGSHTVQPTQTCLPVRHEGTFYVKRKTIFGSTNENKWINSSQISRDEVPNEFQ